MHTGKTQKGLMAFMALALVLLFTGPQMAGAQDGAAAEMMIMPADPVMDPMPMPEPMPPEYDTGTKGKEQRPQVVDGCVVGGCSGEVCHEASAGPMASICIWREAFACYPQYGQCVRQENGACGWTQTEELLNCIEEADNKMAPEPMPLPQ